MTINSKLFDRIKIKPRYKAEPEVRAPGCDWEGCDQPGMHRAPKGHRSAGQFHNFCLDHVRHYNKAFNYFAGMDEDEIRDHMYRNANSSAAGATFDIGSEKLKRAQQRQAKSRPRDFTGRRFSDPLNLFARAEWAQGRNPITERERRILEADRRALETLGLDGRKSGDEIKSAYKSLVKKHHPDANGGDRGSEDRLRAIIAAYTHLKQKGFV